MNRETFWKNVTIRGPEDCWTWKRANKDGYGAVVIDGVRWYAHRFAYSDKVGPIPAGLQILHKCDNPPCCNPAHLRPGTNADNVADMIAKGRNSPPPNMAGWNKKPLPVERLGTLPDYKLAAELGVSKTIVMRRRQSLKIPSYSERTGHNGRFVDGKDVNSTRWSKCPPR